jgi:PhzF family phenazine biosynthesis protein
MNLPIYQVDAFSRHPFQGNPAAVVPLDSWLAPAVMQAIADENNLAETAFYVREQTGYRIRWFTPTVEVELCGHATLAAAAVMTMRGEWSGGELLLASRSGELRVFRDEERYVLDFPSQPVQPTTEPPGLFSALGATPQSILKSQYFMCVFETEAQVQALAPNMFALNRAEYGGIIVTAPGDDCDFISRLFAPFYGIPEDPVTGSAHTILTPYWSQRLGKKSLFARQVSKRGGELWCEDRGSRIHIGGYVASYLVGTITIP